MNMRALSVLALFLAIVFGVLAVLLKPPESILMVAVAGLILWTWSKIK